ncbi:MAG: DUF885 family protein [Rheinheimera sp.]|nr:DUF885 family protein [Rheinheimera sp.]
MRHFNRTVIAKVCHCSAKNLLLNIRFLWVWLFLFVSSTAFARADFQSWVDQFAIAWMKTTPSLSSRVEFLPPEIQHQMDRQLTSFSAEAAESRARLAQQGLQQLGTFRLSDLTAEQQITARIIQFELSSVLENAKYAALKYPFEQMSGAHLMVVETLTRFHPIRHKTDVDNYIARLRLVAPVSTRLLPWPKRWSNKDFECPEPLPKPLSRS